MTNPLNKVLSAQTASLLLAVCDVVELGIVAIRAIIAKVHPELPKEDTEHEDEQ